MTKQEILEIQEDSDDQMQTLLQIVVDWCYLEKSRKQESKGKEPQILREKENWKGTSSTPQDAQGL